MNIEMDRFFTLRINNDTSNSGNVNREWRLIQDDEHGKGWRIYLNEVFTGVAIFKPVKGRPRITIYNKVMADNLPVDLQKYYFQPSSGSHVVKQEDK